MCRPDRWGAQRAGDLAPASACRTSVVVSTCGVMLASNPEAAAAGSRACASEAGASASWPPTVAGADVPSQTGNSGRQKKQVLFRQKARVSDRASRLGRAAVPRLG